MLNPIYFLMYATGEKINITQIEGNFPQAPFVTREEREDHRPAGMAHHLARSRTIGDPLDVDP